MSARVGVVALALAWSLACGGGDALSGPVPEPVVSPGGDLGGAGGRGGRSKRGKKGGAGAPAPAGGGIYCQAQGVYQVCVDQGDGWEQCSHHTANGGGIGSSEAEASSNAVIDCGAHMTNMIIIDGMSGRASVAQSCVATGCN